jgi:hypothetical protein
LRLCKKSIKFPCPKDPVITVQLLNQDVQRDNRQLKYRVRTERLYLDPTKDAYSRATNKKDEYVQMTVWLERKEKVLPHPFPDAQRTPAVKNALVTDSGSIQPHLRDWLASPDQRFVEAKRIRVHGGIVSIVTLIGTGRVQRSQSDFTAKANSESR